MTAPCALCPTSATWHGRHYIADRRWRVVTPDDRETVLCSVACALTWLVYGLPADVATATAPHGRNSEGGAAA